MGTLVSGAAYLPIDPSIPRDRLRLLLEDSGTEMVLTQSHLDEAIDWPDNITRFSVDRLSFAAECQPLTGVAQKPEDLAYVIYTSGSTGVPKGVMIDHRGAVNTILDINRRFGVSPEDGVLAVSNLNFDLSVYDIFGVLAEGGTIVMPDPNGTRDPAHWLDIMKKENVTLWNSVPALMEMLLEYSSGKNETIPQKLRLVLMSGDWIPLSLPGRIREVAPGADLISLGGATEASIWSIMYPIGDLWPEWKSIPYGKPMANQRFYVLNRFLEPCPDWVPGQLYIGGDGLALGYWNDSEKTGKSFIIHPKTGERLYRTGDMGRYLPDGNIEFLGREDLQVKIRGHRIELGEIEETVKLHPGVYEAVVVAAKDQRGDRFLAGYVVPGQDENNPLFVEEKGDPAGIRERWDLIVEKGRLKAENAFAGMDARTFPLFWEYMEKLGVLVMCRTLNALGAFNEPCERYSADSLMDRCGIDSRYQPLMDQWIEVLLEDGLLKSEDDATLVNTTALVPDLLEKDILPALGGGSGWERYGSAILEYFSPAARSYPKLLRGETDPLELFFLNDLSLSPDRLLSLVKGVHEVNTIAAEIMEFAARREAPGKVRIMEIGSRAGTVAGSLVPVLPADRVLYTVTDNSPFFINIVKEKFRELDHVDYKLLDMNEDPLAQGFEPHCFDIVVAGYSLHRARNIKAALRYLRSLLAPGGMLLLLESTRNSRLQLVSVGLLEEGFVNFADERAESRRPLISAEKWEELLRNAGFEDIVSFPAERSPLEVFGKQLMAARAPMAVNLFNAVELQNFLREKLPDYMIPHSFNMLYAIPLTSNGKVDRKALSERGGVLADRGGEVADPRTPVESGLVEIWRKILDIDQIGIRDNFFELGGDSLLGTQMVTQIRNKFKVEVSLRILFQSSTIERLADHIEKLLSEHDREEKSVASRPVIVPDKEKKHEPFMLTDVQQAYWIGRTGIFELGNVSTHSYFEIEGKGLDIERLNQAWRKLVDYHDMMRAVIFPNGQQQRILAEVTPYSIPVLDLRGEDPEKTTAALGALRKEMSHQVLSTDSWPLFDIRACLWGDDRVRIHVSFDNLIFDGWSMLYLFKEWARLYNSPEARLTPLDLSFRDYVIAVRNLEGTGVYKADEEYWLKRLPQLPPAPDLPLAVNPGSLTNHRFRRLELIFASHTWKSVKERAQQRNLTPSGLLLAAYAEILSLWSKTPRFTINLTLFNRLPVHPQVNDIVGDFTSLTLLEVNGASGYTFTERAQNIQRQLWEDLDHPYIGGVRVLREYARLNGADPRSAVMPVVFTSALGLSAFEQDASGITQLGDLVYNITQTPQVWLDHQVYENAGDLVLIWDAVEDLFPPGLLEDMFDAYCWLLRDLARDDGAWQRRTRSLLPSRQKEIRAKVNATEEPVPDELLHTLFEAQVKKRPRQHAVIAHGQTLTYEELHTRVARIGHLLRENGASANTLVAVVMEKGWEQVAAVLGILMSGAAYLPIDPSAPRDRLWHLLRHGEARLALTQNRFHSELEWPEEVLRFPVDSLHFDSAGVSPLETVQKPEDLAYVIFTSGSTGLPKGVMIDHRGAVNTILDINRRFGVVPEDRVLSVSNLNFDLSVYDIFGLLAAGGTIVMPHLERRKDPSHWIKTMQQEGITMWNSVPALMQALVEYMADRDERAPLLRLALFRGDWLPLPLQAYNLHTADATGRHQSRKQRCEGYKPGRGHRGVNLVYSLSY